MRKKSLTFALILGLGVLFTASGCTQKFCTDTEEAAIRAALQAEIVAADLADDSYSLTAEQLAKAVDDAFARHPQACITLTEAEDPTTGVTIAPKTWADAWSKGLVEGLLVYPIALLIMYLVDVFSGLFAAAGWAQVMAIVITTIIVRGVTVPFTAKSSKQAQKLQEINPELMAIQAKYQNSQDPNDKQRQSVEMMKLYEKYGVNPLSAMVAPFITLPIFIAVWGAVNGTLILREGEIFGLNLADSLSTGILGMNWFAIILMVVMIVTQFLTMKLPQWLSKRNKKHTKALNDPKAQAMQKQQNMMTYVFMGMIVLMGWSLPTAMTLYWVSSSIFSVGQTFITHSMLVKEGV